MKPFRFALQPLRAVREHKEQAARERYAAALQGCELAAARVQQAGTELSSCWVCLGEQLAEGVSGNDLLRTRAWCNVLELRLKERAAALEQARLAVDRAWQELAVATRERETLERFHDKRRRLYDLAQQREDQKALDEIAIQLSRSPLGLNAQTHAAPCQ